MRIATLIAVGWSVALGTLPGVAQDHKLPDLTGVWVITEFREDADRPEPDFEGGELVVAGSRMAIGPKKSAERANAVITRFRLGQGDGKPAFDLIVVRDGKEVLMPGICRVVGDRLEVCCGETVRPDSYAGGAGRVLIRAKRFTE
jgi:hypothetical protein